MRSPRCDPCADGAQSTPRPLPRGREREPAAEGALARGAGQRRAPGDERPLVGASADRAQPCAAPVPDAPPRRAEVLDRDRLPALAQGRRGDHRRRLPDARPRDVDPPPRSRGVQPLPRRRSAPRAAGEGLRGARAHDHRLRDPARDHRPPQGRAPAHDRGGRRARRRRARHGAGPLARVVRDEPREHPLAQRGRDRRGPDRPGRGARGAGRGADEQLGGVFQVDELLASKLRGSGLEKYIEVVARIDAEHEKRLLRVYQI